MKTEDREIAENNEMIDHVEAIRELVERKCSRCKSSGKAYSCMGCVFQSYVDDADAVPACLDRILFALGARTFRTHDTTSLPRRPNAMKNAETFGKNSEEKMKCDLKLFDGHIIANLADGDFLIDTGSLESFSRTGSLIFCGRNENVPKVLMGMVDAEDLSDLVGIALDGLIGMDILSQHSIVFAGEEMFVDECPIPDEGFSIIGENSFMGIPMASLKLNEHFVKVFIDTGAKISYLAPPLLEAYGVEETLQDFYPGLGRFSVDLSSVRFEIAGFPMTGKFGRLPPMLQMTLTMGGAQGILGHDLFSHFLVRLEKGASTVSIARRQFFRT
ncbi:MAG: hypothetical protein ACI4QT_03885 [Kiritimatiellia bacterium]